MCLKEAKQQDWVGDEMFDTQTRVPSRVLTGLFCFHPFAWQDATQLSQVLLEETHKTRRRQAHGPACEKCLQTDD